MEYYQVYLNAVLHIYSKIESLRKNGSNPNLPDLFNMIYSTLHESVVQDYSMLKIIQC